MRIVRYVAWVGLVTTGVFGCGSEAPTTGDQDEAEAEPVDVGGVTERAKAVTGLLAKATLVWVAGP